MKRFFGVLYRCFTCLEEKYRRLNQHLGGTEHSVKEKERVIMFWNRHAVVMKMTIVFWIGVMIMPLGMNVVWQHHSREILVDQFVKESDRMVEQLNVNIKNYFDSIWLGVFETISNENVRNIINNRNMELTDQEYATNEACLQRYLDRIRYYNRDIFRVTLLTDVYQVDSIGGKVRKEEIECEKWYQNFLNSDKAVDISGVYYKDFGTGVKTPIVSYVQKFSSQNNLIGVVIIDIRYTKIKGIFDTAFNRENSQLYVFDAGQLIYSPEGFKSAEALSESEKELLLHVDIEEFPMEYKYNGQEKILVKKSGEFPGWVILELVDRKQLVSSADALFMGFNSMILIVGILFALVMVAVLYKMLWPLVAIEQKMRLIEQNQFTVRFENPRKDEFGRIENGFNQMISHIEDLLQNIAREEKEKRDMAIRTLRAQIDPHFLYNTLNVIRWRAVMDKNEEVSRMIVELIHTMEFNGKRKEEFVTIQEEIESVNHYVRLLKYQYGDKFEVFYEIEDEVRDKYICKMILQPLVENSVFHGIIPGLHQGEIRIQVTQNKDCIHFLVQDNGVGMTDEQEKGILQGIGVSNVNDRLRYYWGEKSSLKIENNFGNGVTISFSVPVLEEIPLDRIVLQKDEVRDNESDDC